eukprot:Phypoly_transcript_03224.p1 GENE.Phypoly_transcript_03224~~Phypoly_transcript_03224.p1  ORF type:complete len:663 (+),score=76.48 Phypoly_transcript_03224:508-2496(+)
MVIISIDISSRRFQKNTTHQDGYNENHERFRTSKKYFKFASRPARVELVLGRPLVEDMDSHIPSDTLKVTTKDSSVTLDTDEVYRQFRRYGKLFHVTKEPQANPVIVRYNHLEGAIAARNCLHKYPLPTAATGVVILIDYVQVQRMGWLKEHFKTNTKFMLPLVGFLATFLGYILFDPIRTWFIKRNMERTFRGPTDLSNLQSFGSLCKNPDEDHLKYHLLDPPNYVTVVSAPKGTGMSDLVCSILRGKKNVFMIDFGEMDSIPDADFINYIADCIGYYPTVTWMSQISGWIDVLPLGLAKGSFAWSAHSELENIFFCLERALCAFARKSIDNTHIEWPVLVLDGFLENLAAMENRKEARLLLDVFGEFAVKCQKKGLAHILVLSNDPSAEHIISNVITSNRGSKVKKISLSDVSNEAASSYIRTSLIPLESRPSEEDVQGAVDCLGGRISDLEAFTQRVLAGGPPEKVINKMINRTVDTIRVDGFGYTPGKIVGDDTRKWTHVQLWQIIKKIAEKDFVYYDDIVANVFGGNVELFTSLLSINILLVKGNRVIAYSSLHRAAFQRMVHNKSISVPMDMQVLKEALEDSSAKLKKMMHELGKLKSMRPVLGSIRKSLHLFQTETLIQERDLERQISTITKKISTINTKMSELETVFLSDFLIG